MPAIHAGYPKIKDHYSGVDMGYLQKSLCRTQSIVKLFFLSGFPNICACQTEDD